MNYKKTEYRYEEGGRRIMFFRRKLRHRFDERLLESLEKVKQEWLTRKKLVEQSIEPSYVIVYELKLAEAKYLFLLKEAKRRKLTLK